MIRQQRTCLGVLRWFKLRFSMKSNDSVKRSRRSTGAVTLRDVVLKGLVREVVLVDVAA